MILDTENISISLSKYEKKHGKSPDFIGSVYDHEKKEKVGRVFGRYKEWPDGTKYIHIQIVEMDNNKPIKSDKPTIEEDEELPF